MRDNNISFRFTEPNKNDLNYLGIINLIGLEMPRSEWGIISQLMLNYINEISSDKVSFYGNKKLGLCLRFRIAIECDPNIEEDILILTDILGYPEFYEKTEHKIKKEAQRYLYFQEGLNAHIEALKTHFAQILNHDADK